LLTAGLLLSLVLPLFADDPDNNWLARSWQTEEGLSDNSVTGVAQTSDGYLWVGTPSGGLNRFDGLQFEAISLTNVIAFPNRGVVGMLRGRHGALWLAMDRGAVVRLSGDTSRSFVDELPTFTPGVMAEDAAGSLWISYHGGSVYCAKESGATQATEQQGLPPNIRGVGNPSDVCALATDLRGRVWFGKSGAVGVITNGFFETKFHFGAQSMRLAPAHDGSVWLCCGFHLYKCSDSGESQDLGEFHPEGSGNTATAMLEDRDGNVWIGTAYGGLYRYSRSVFQAVTTSRLGILSLTEDREGNIWAGTDGGGLSRYRRPAIMLEDASTGLPLPSVLSVCAAPDGAIWAATQNGVLARYVNGQWKSIAINNDPQILATCVNADARGTVWVGTHNFGLYAWQNGKFADWIGATNTQDLTFHTVVAATNGDLWLGQESPSGVVRVRDGKLTMFPVNPTNRIIRAMVQDPAGDVWIGTSRGNLLRIHDEQIADVTPRSSQELAPIRCLYVTPDGTLWLGYAGWGVGCLKNGHYSEFNSSLGLFDDSISHIVADDQGWLWFGANKGIFKVRLNDFADVAAGKASRVRSVHYGRGEGLPSLQGTYGDSPDVLRSRDGRLWIPMKTGLAVVDPAKLAEQTGLLLTLLTRVTVDDRVVAEYDSVLPGPASHDVQILDPMAKDITLSLPPDFHSLKFEYAAFDFSAPENIEFRHQLKNADADWVESGAAREAQYSRLASGKYEFQLAACNGNGDWNLYPGRMTIIVAPFFWERWWFRLAVILVFTLTIVAVVRYVSFRRLHARLRVLEQQAALQRERTRIAKDIHDDLGANLTQIAYLGELANQDRGDSTLVGERIGKISAAARQSVKSLDEIVWAVNPRNDTLAHLLDYAGQFALDYLRTVGIRCRLDFPTEVPDRELSTDLRHNLFLVIKETLHNIFKHANATEVWLRAVVDEQALEVVIEDNGRGFDTTPDNAFADGLRNMSQRMEEIGGSFRIQSQPGSGTKIFLRLPWPASS
jgi:signal transduction histidine kinase/ligand-binding sensor domain-containing protein